VEAYEYLDGMPELLQDLKDAGVEMHAMSNYPVWYRHINDKLRLDRQRCCPRLQNQYSPQQPL
jgi:hypothetical protein